MDFPTSSHRCRWLFTEAQLLDLRHKNREASLAVIKKAKEAGQELLAGLAADGEAGRQHGKQKKARAVTLEEEAALLKFYQSKMQGLCRALGFPTKVQAAALVLLKRFYLAFSVLDHDPKNIMLTCIYLAGKVEEAYIGVEDFCSRVRQEEAAVLRAEPALLQALRFDLVTHSPYRALAGFLMDLEAACDEPGAGGLEPSLAELVTGAGGLARARGAAAAAVDALMLTDAPLLFPPGQLALAGLRSGVRKLGAPFGSYLERVARRAALGAPAAAADTLSNGAAAATDGGRGVAGKAAGGTPEGPAERVERLRGELARIDALGAQGAEPVDDEAVRRIDRRLKACHNPLLDPASAAFRAEEAAREQAAAAARQRKACPRHETLAGVPPPPE